MVVRVVVVVVGFFVDFEYCCGKETMTLKRNHHALCEDWYYLIEMRIDLNLVFVAVVVVHVDAVAAYSRWTTKACSNQYLLHY